MIPRAAVRDSRVAVGICGRLQELSKGLRIVVGFGFLVASTASVGCWTELLQTQLLNIT